MVSSEPKRRRKTGIMGGTFNPVHLGHLLLAENAYSALSLDEVLFMPSGISYMKEQSAILDGHTRLVMTRLATEDNPHFRVSSLEVEREGYTYTSDTLRQLTGENPNTDYYFLVGADTLFSIESWREPEEIFRMAVLAAAVRDDCDRASLEKQADRLKEIYNARIVLLPAGRIEISSSRIRERISRGLSVRYMVPEPVRLYIEENRLYLKHD